VSSSVVCRSLDAWRAVAVLFAPCCYIMHLSPEQHHGEAAVRLFVAVALSICCVYWMRGCEWRAGLPHTNL
jgi:hypothetical protein